MAEDIINSYRLKRIDMQAKIIEKCNVLLKPLGLHMGRCKNNGVFAIFDGNSTASHQIATFAYRRDEDRIFLAHDTNIFNLWQHTICKAEFIVKFKTSIDGGIIIDFKPNPYVGCASYEEALIRKDLFINA